MSVAAKTGRAIGRGLGRTAAFAWKGTVAVAEATGTFGEAALEGASSGWEDQCQLMDAKAEARRQRVLALKAAQQVAQQLPATITTVAA